MTGRNPALSARHAAARQLQDQRRAELDRIRCQRRLTEAEAAEDDRLARALELRVWRDATRADEARIDHRIAAHIAHENQRKSA